MDYEEKQYRTRRLEDGVHQMEMLMDSFPEEDDAGIYYSLRRAKEACFRAVELSKEDEEGDHESHPNTGKRLLEFLESVLGDDK